MKIAISTQYNHDFEEIAAITIPIMHEYCKRHGYILDASPTPSKSPAIIWERISDALMLLDSGCDAVMHMDADALITNLSVSVEDILSLLPNLSDADLVATAENDIINDGCCIWRATLGTMSAMQDIFSKLGEFSSPQDVINNHAAALDVYHVSPRTMNSVLNAEYGNVNPLTEWQDGDFVLHLPGVGNARRVELLKEYSQKIIR